MTTKICKICNVEKEYSKFHFHKECTGGVVGTCRECTKEGKAKWHKDNRKNLQEKSNSLNRNSKAFWVEEKGGRCTDCKVVFPLCVYQFHHVDGTKEVNPSAVLRWRLERARQEMDKCILLCANCHMIRHHGSY